MSSPPSQAPSEPVRLVQRVLERAAFWRSFWGHHERVELAHPIMVGPARSWRDVADHGWWDLLRCWGRAARWWRSDRSDADGGALDVPVASAWTRLLTYSGLLVLLAVFGQYAGDHLLGHLPSSLTVSPGSGTPAAGLYRRGCIERFGARRCVAAGLPIGLGDLQASLVPGAVLSSTLPRRAPDGFARLPTLSVHPHDEAVFVRSRAGEVWMGTLPAGAEPGVVRVGALTLAPSSPDHIVPVGLSTTEVGALPLEGGRPVGPLLAVLLALAGLLTPWLSTRIRLWVHRARCRPNPDWLAVLVAAAPRRSGLPMRSGAASVVAVGAMLLWVSGSYRLRSFRYIRVWEGTELLDFAHTLVGLEVIDELAIAVHITLLLVWGAVVVVDAADALLWDDEVEDLASILGTPRDAELDDPLRAEGAPRGLTLEQQRILQRVDSWDRAKPMSQRLLEIGLLPPPLPYGLPPAALLSAGADLEVVLKQHAWARTYPRAEALGPEGTVAEDAVSSRSDHADELLPSRDVRGRLQMNAADTSRPQALVAMLQLMVREGLLTPVGTQLQLSELGRRAVALPSLALADSLPFPAQRALAMAESRLATGDATRAVMDCGTLLEKSCKQLLARLLPPTWSEVKAAPELLRAIAVLSRESTVKQQMKSRSDGAVARTSALLGGQLHLLHWKWPDGGCSAQCFGDDQGAQAVRRAEPLACSEAYRGWRVHFLDRASEASLAQLLTTLLLLVESSDKASPERKSLEDVTGLLMADPITTRVYRLSRHVREGRNVAAHDKGRRIGVMEAARVVWYTRIFLGHCWELVSRLR